MRQDLLWDGSHGGMFGAGNETRTRDPNLGKVVLYQLSYSRIAGLFILVSADDVSTRGGATLGATEPITTERATCR